MSFVKIWIHVVWGTKRRTPFLTSKNKWAIIAHIKENAKRKGIKIDFINGVKDHIHCLILLSVDQSIARCVQLIKGESSYWINKNSISQGKFEWADEYYAVSVCESHINSIRDYIKNQDEHHKKKSWDEECENFLRKYGFERIKG